MRMGCGNGLQKELFLVMKRNVICSSTFVALLRLGQFSGARPPSTSVVASEKRVFAITGVLLILAVTSFAQPTPITITTSSGQVFKDIRIVKTDPDGLVYVYSFYGHG